MLPSVPLPVPRCKVSASSPAWPGLTFTMKMPGCPGSSVADDG